MKGKGKGIIHPKNNSMKQSGNDNYDLNTSSPQGHAGFEPFRTEKHFYFHFNDEAGDCILFSQAYKTKKGCDNGMISVKKNIKKKAHLILHHDDDLHYFTIKAGNNQEVARSRNYESEEEMASSIQYLYQQLGVNYFAEPKKENRKQIIKELKENLTEREAIEKELREKLWELETALAETSNSLNESLLQKEIWIKEKAGLEAKMVILAKRSSDLEVSKHTLRESNNTLEEIPTSNFSFHINFYNVENNEAVKMAIYHPMTKDKKILVGFDKEAMIEFMLSKLPSTVHPLITHNIEKELDSTKITETVFITQNISSRSTAPAQNIVDTPSITNENIEEENHFQKKALVEATKSSNMSISNPATTSKSVETQVINTPEELAIIKRFFDQEISVDPAKKIAVAEKIEANINNTETTEINGDQTVYTAEELTIIKKFFGQKINAAPTNKITAQEEIKINLANLEAEKINTVQAEKIIERFFPKIKKGLEEKKDSPNIKVLDITFNPQLEIDEGVEIALVERFFPSFTKSKEEEIAAQIEIDKLLNEVSQESEKNSGAEIKIIKKFFGAKIKEEKMLLPKPLNLNIFPVETIPENHKEGQEIINKFFGKKFQKTVAKSRTVQSISTNAKGDNIRLYNKLFGKNIPVKRSKKCCS